MRRLVFLLLGHVAALLLCLGGLLVALPHPGLWAGSPWGITVFRFGVRVAGPAYILLGAAAMAGGGIQAGGWRRTAVFFAAAVGISLGAELLGTTTGWPFGPYSYTTGLGPKVLGRVPAVIPLSWFSMGLASYLIARRLLGDARTRLAGLAPALLGACLLGTWDLVLDPAMASSTLPIRFWVWYRPGPYLGMPLQNLLGWFVTGLAYMAIGGLPWRESDQKDSSPLPGIVYAANLGFAAAICAAEGLWVPLGLGAAIWGLIGLATGPLRLGNRRSTARLAGLLPEE
jgi:uncharacterized membrane protein